jgi:hypothetical protein
VFAPPGDLGSLRNMGAINRKTPRRGTGHKQTLCQKTRAVKFSPNKIVLFFFLENADTLCMMMRKKERKKMRNLIVLNTKAELIDFLNNNNIDTLVDNVAFGLDLLDMVRANDNEIAIDEELGFCDDGGWIRIDDMGYVVEEFAVP